MKKYIRVYPTLLLAMCLALSALTGAAGANMTNPSEQWQPTMDEEWLNMLTGSWHASESMGRGYGRRALFGEDICYLLPDDEESAEDALEGNYWTVIDGELIIHYGEGEIDYTRIIPLSWVTSNKIGDEDMLYEVMFGDTIMFKYMNEIDWDVNLGAYGFGD